MNWKFSADWIWESAHGLSRVFKSSYFKTYDDKETSDAKSESQQFFYDPNRKKTLISIESKRKDWKCTKMAYLDSKEG